MNDARSIPGVVDVETVRGAACAEGATPALVVEVPHGATDASDYEAVRGRLHGDLPDRLEHFFFVNTDVGAYELGRRAAELVVAARPACAAIVLRCRIPRTFIDTNRLLGEEADGSTGITAGIPPYVRHPADIAVLQDLYRRYQDAVTPLLESVFAAGGLGLLPHTYAPREVGIDRVDDEIVDNLHAAYEPGVYEGWPLRPEVDLIVRTADGEDLAPPGIADELLAAYRGAGFGAEITSSYYLHPATTAYARAVGAPGRITTLEVRRDLLVEEWRPFAEMRVDDERVERAARPLADALAARCRAGSAAD